MPIVLTRRSSYKATIETMRDSETRAYAMSVADRLVQEGLEQGLEQGLEKGALIGRIQMLQNLLHREETSTDLLAQHTIDELRALCFELKKAMH